MADRDTSGFLAGGGAMGMLIRSFDWQSTGLGPIGSWPQNMLTTLGIIINSRFPMLLFWGPDLIQFYNDAYKESLDRNGKHPEALGQKAKECWPEVWDTMGPPIEQVLNGGAASWNEDQHFEANINGSIEDVYWTYSYSPVKDEAGNIGGVFVACTETTEKIVTLAKLKASEQRLFNFIRDATVGIIVISSPELKIELINDACCGLIGQPAAQMTGKNLFDVIPEAAQAILPVVDKVRLTGNGVHLNDHPYLFNTPLGPKAGYMSLDVEPYKETNGEIKGLTIFCQDVTGQVMIRRKADEHMQNLRNVFEQAPLAMAFFRGADSVVEIANSSCLRIWGRTAAQALGNPLFDVIPEVRNNGFEEILRHVYTTGASYSVYGTPVTLIRDGNTETIYLTYSYEPFREPDGTITGIMALAIDVTEEMVARKRIDEAQNQLKDTTRSLELALDAGNLGSYELILATGEIICTPQCKKNFGTREEEPLNYQRLMELIIPEDREGRQDLIRQSLDHKTIYNAEYRIKAPDNGIRWVKVAGIPIDDASGKPWKMVGITLDITEQKLFAEQLGKQVLERTLALQRSNEDLLQFAHVTSHDLKEPVRKVKLFTSRAQDEFGHLLPDMARQYLDKVQNASNRMLTMIEGVLAYSTVSSRHEPVYSVDLNTVIGDIENDLEVLIAQTSVVIRKEELPVIEGASILIYQLFYNIINNAIKFLKPGVPGLISISADLVIQDELAYAKVMVRDNGIGFEQTYSEKIFDAFSRLNSKDDYEGTGLGLSLGKRIVERHKGRISATGVLHEGAVITVLLPLKQEQKSI